MSVCSGESAVQLCRAALELMGPFVRQRRAGAQREAAEHPGTRAEELDLPFSAPPPPTRHVRWVPFWEVLWSAGIG